MPKPVRAYLPADSSAFALPLSKSRSHASLLDNDGDDNDEQHPLLYRRLRRPSLPSSTDRLSSPLAHEAFAPLHRSSLLKLEADQDRMWTDRDSTSCSSENATPPLLQGSTTSEKELDTEGDMAMKTSRPQTPPRRSPSTMDVFSEPSSSAFRSNPRRISCPVRLVSLHCR